MVRKAKRHSIMGLPQNLCDALYYLTSPKILVLHIPVHRLQEYLIANAHDHFVIGIWVNTRPSKQLPNKSFASQHEKYMGGMCIAVVVFNDVSDKFLSTECIYICSCIEAKVARLHKHIIKI